VIGATRRARRFAVVCGVCRSGLCVSSGFYTGREAELTSGLSLGPCSGQTRGSGPRILACLGNMIARG
jgi:hypothetical protein